jgi:hypothetical protein
MTAPTFANLTTILTGWVFADRRCVTGLIEAAGAVDGKHFSVYGDHQKAGGQAAGASTVSGLAGGAVLPAQPEKLPPIAGSATRIGVGSDLAPSDRSDPGIE